MNNSITKKPINCYSNFLKLVHILHMRCTQKLEVSKPKNLLEKPLNSPEVPGICNPSKSQARSNRSLKLCSKLKYLN